jgi:integrase
MILARMAPDRWRREHPSEYVVGKRLARTPFVFPSITRQRSSEHVSTEAMLRCWHELVRPAAGLPATFGLHGLRGAFVNMCHEAGLPVTTTAALVGHENWKTTLTYYSRPTDQQLAKAGEKVGRLILGA